MGAKQLFLLMGIPLIIIGTIFYLDNATAPSITGFATAEKQDNVLGKYSVSPNFKVSMDYKFDDYKRLKELAEFIIQCSAKSSVENCMQQAEAKDDSFAWELDCDKGAEKALYELAMFYQSCIDSADTNCLCKKNFKVGEKIKKDELNKLYEIFLEEDSLRKEITLKIENQDVELSQIVKKRGTVGWAPRKYKVGYTYDYKFLDLNMFFVNELEPPKKNDEEIHSLGPLDELALYRYQKEDLTIVDFVKDNKENNELEYPSHSSRNIKKPEGLHDCFLKPRNHYRFCATKKNYKIRAYDIADNDTKTRELVYKFAIDFPEPTPAPITSLQAVDAPKSDNSIMLTWDKTDEISFFIYYSTKNFADIKISDAKKDDAIKKIKAESYTIIEDMDLENCDIVIAGQPCRFAGHNKALDKNKLYYVKSKNKFVYIIDGLENVDYNFAVTGTNDEEMEINNDKSIKDNVNILTSNKNYAKARPVDDLAPGKVINLGWEPGSSISGSKDKIKWNKPSSNIDGTSLKDFKSFKVYYRESVDEFKEYSLATILTETEAKCTTSCEFEINAGDLGLVLDKTYRFGVTAIDDLGNEYKNFDTVLVLVSIN